MPFLRPRVYGKRLSRVKRSPSYLSSPGRANFSNISLQNFTNRLHGKQKVSPARKVTRLAGSPTFDGRVFFLAGPTVLHINTLARPSGCPGQLDQGETSAQRARRARRARLAFNACKGVNFFLIQTLAKVDIAERATLLPGTTFLRVNGA